MSDKTRILVISHGHPDNAKGGGEIAAYNLHNKLNTTAEYHSVFLARHANDAIIHPGTLLSGSGRPNEIMLHSDRMDYFQHSQHNKVLVGREFRHTLERVNPDVIHFHHYIHLGLELIREARAFNPDVKIILTLHEYIAICNNNGQMMTTSNTLCHEASPQACIKCFPQHPPQDFLMRKLFFKSHFEHVDAFVSPSQFLKDRYVAWGISEERIRVIENMLDESTFNDAPADNSTTAQTAERVRFAFFGQINWFKGLDLLLEAILKLPDDVRDQIQLDINGTGLENQPANLQHDINAMLEKLSDVANMRGPYTQMELSTLMNSADWLIVPSKWWENSPMVILEARKHGLPVICSNIGGMAEKVHDKLTGIHFQAGRSEALAKAIEWAVENPGERTSYAAKIKEDYKDGEAFDQHIALYENLLSEELDDSTTGTQPEADNIRVESNVYSIRTNSDAA